MAHPATVRGLIHLGRSGQAGTPAGLPSSEYAVSRELLRLPSDEAVEQLKEEEHRHLIQGLVLYWRAGGFAHGSVSPVIWLYRIYESHFPDVAKELADWIRSHTPNYYERRLYLGPDRCRPDVVKGWLQERRQVIRQIDERNHPPSRLQSRQDPV